MLFMLRLYHVVDINMLEYVKTFLANVREINNLVMFILKDKFVIDLSCLFSNIIMFP